MPAIEPPAEPSRNPAPTERPEDAAAALSPDEPSLRRRLMAAAHAVAFTLVCRDGVPVTLRHGPEVEDLSGYSAAQVGTDPFQWFRIVVADDLETITRWVEAVARGRPPADPVRFRLRHRHGREVALRLTGRLSATADGQAVYAGMLQEETPSPADAAANGGDLRAPAFGQLVDALPAGLALAEHPGCRLLQTNACMEEITGFTGAELRARTFLDLLEPADRALERAWVDHLVDDPEGIPYSRRRELHFQTRHGRQVAARVATRVVPDAEGRASRLLHLVEPAAPGRSALAADRGEWYRGALDAMTDGAVVVDPAGNTLFVNRSFIRMFDLPPDLRDRPAPDALWRHIERHAADDTDFPGRLALAAARDPEGEKRDPVSIFYPNGRVITCVGLVFRDARGMPAGRLYSFRDATNRLRDLENMQQSVDALREMQHTAQIGGWEHDLSTGKTKWTEGMFLLFDERGDATPSLEAIAQHAAETHAEELRRLFAEASLRGQPFSATVPAVSAKGRSFWMVVFGRALLEDGRPTRLLGAVQDITRLHTAQEALESSEKRFRLAMETAYDGHWDYDILMDSVYFSPRCAQILDYPPDHFGSDFTVWNSLIHPEDRERALLQFQEHIEWSIPYRIEYRVRARDGEYRWILAGGQVVAREGESGTPLRMIGVLTDITELQQARAQAAAAEVRFQTIYENAGLGIATLDIHDARIEHANAAFLDMFGLPPTHEKTSTLFDLLPADDIPSSRQAFECLVTAQTNRYTAEKRMVGARGEFLWVNLTCTTIRDPSGLAQSAVALVEDVTERRKLQEKLEYDATHDRLTGASNRGRLLENLNHSVGLAHRNHRPMTFAICDIDFFKKVNDQHLHVTGDAVLVRFARILEESVRATDTVGRYGGEEFGLVFPDTDRDGAVICLERAFARLRTEKFKSLKNGEEFHITATCGVAVLADGMRPEQLIAAADEALYKGKQEGRNRIVLAAADPVPSPEAEPAPTP